MNIREFITHWTFKADKEPLEKIEHHLEGIKERLEFLAAAEVVKGLYELTERFGKFAEQLHIAAESAGITVEEFQKLTFAAEQSAVSSEEMGGAMARLGRHLYDARKGSVEAQQAFALAGFSGEQIAGFHTTQDAMLALSDRFKNIQDPIKKQAIAMELLGRGSHNMVGFLSKGSAAIKGMGIEADKLGIILSHHQVEALVSVEHSMYKFGAVLKNIGATIAVYLAPIINTAVEYFLKFYAANKKILDSNIERWAEDVAYALGFMYGIVEGLAQRFLDFAKTHQTLLLRIFEVIGALAALSLGALALGKSIEILGNLFSGLGVIVGPLKFLWASVFGPLVTWIGTLVQGAMVELTSSLAVLTLEAFPSLGVAIGTFSAFLEATPVGWFATALAAIVVVAHDLWTILSGGKFEDTWISKAWEAMKGLAAGTAKFFGFGGDDKAAGGASPGASLATTGSNALQNITDLQSTAQSSPLDAFQSEPNSSRVSEQSFNINAPATINVIGTDDPKKTAQKVQDSYREHTDRTHREAARSLTAAASY